MANTLRGEAHLSVGGDDYALSLGINEIIEAEDALDTDFKTILEQSFGEGRRARIGVLRAFLWAALRRNHAYINLMRAGELVVEMGINEAYTLVLKLLSDALPKPKGPAGEGDADPPKTTETAGTG